MEIVAVSVGAPEPIVTRPDAHESLRQFWSWVKLICPAGSDTESVGLVPNPKPFTVNSKDVPDCHGDGGLMLVTEGVGSPLIVKVIELEVAPNVVTIDTA
jgi:hypothetical protein